MAGDGFMFDRIVITAANAAQAKGYIAQTKHLGNVSVIADPGGRRCFHRIFYIISSPVATINHRRVYEIIQNRRALRPGRHLM